jgi:hypothetical protein
MDGSTGVTSGPGVAPPDGYTTSTDAMSSSGRAITTAAEDAQDDTEDLQPTQLTDAEFGTAHTEHFAGYSAAIEQLGTGAQAMCANLISFAGQLGGAGQAYADHEQAAVQTVTGSGAGL